MSMSRKKAWLYPLATRISLLGVNAQATPTPISGAVDTSLDYRPFINVWSAS